MGNGQFVWVYEESEFPEPSETSISPFRMPSVAECPLRRSSRWAAFSWEVLFNHCANIRTTFMLIRSTSIGGAIGDHWRIGPTECADERPLHEIGP